MKNFRTKGQALALVLIIVVVAVIIGYAITTRVIEDVRQQSEERASTRAETIAESAVENLTQKLQTGELRPGVEGAVSAFGISNQAPSGIQTVSNLGLCDPQSTDISKQCDANSVAKVSYFNMIVQFKLFSNENIEVQLTDAASTVPKTGTEGAIIIHANKSATNDSFKLDQSSIMIKALKRVMVDGKAQVQVVGECVWNLNAATAPAGTCIPNNTLSMALVTCPSVAVDTDQNETTPASQKVLGTNCLSIQPTAGNGVSFYRIKPLLQGGAAGQNSYVDISATGLTISKLPVPQMALINAGVYSGTVGSSQQVFQQSTRLVLLNKSVPEIADYALYNGAEAPISK